MHDKRWKEGMQDMCLELLRISNVYFARFVCVFRGDVGLNRIFGSPGAKLRLTAVAFGRWF